MEDQILLRVPPRIAEPIRRFISGEEDADVALEALGASRGAARSDSGCAMLRRRPAPPRTRLPCGLPCRRAAVPSLPHTRPPTPSADDAGNFLFTVGRETFPAKLARLPTVSETLKTGDHKTYYKSGDVTRILYVYEKGASGAAAGAEGEAGAAGAPEAEAALPDPAGDELGELLPLVADPTPGASGEQVCDSGIAPPLAHVVRRRFRRAHRFISKYPRAEVAEAERVLLDLASRDMYEHVVEEVRV